MTKLSVEFSRKKDPKTYLNSNSNHLTQESGEI